MATVKVKFRASSIPDKEGTLFFQVIHNRVTRQIATGHKIFKREWNADKSEVILPGSEPLRHDYLLSVKGALTANELKIKSIIARLDKAGSDYSVEKVIDLFNEPKNDDDFIAFAQRLINRLKQVGKRQTADTYTTVLNSFKRFRKEQDLPLDDVDSALVMEYETWLKENGICKNTVSFYMRNLRAIYNRAVEKELTTQRFPFKHVYTGVDKTVKRAVPLKVIKRIKEMNFSMNPSFDFARDMFLMSFYTRGMSFVDMAYLRKKDLQNGVLSYRRRKTGQLLFIKWEKCMQEIVNKYDTSQSNYLLPIIKPFGDIDERKQYIYAAHNINRCLKIIGKELGLSVSLTLYVARHKWV